MPGRVKSECARRPEALAAALIQVVRWFSPVTIDRAVRAPSDPRVGCAIRSRTFFAVGLSHLPLSCRGLVKAIAPFQVLFLTPPETGNSHRIGNLMARAECSVERGRASTTGIEWAALQHLLRHIPHGKGPICKVEVLAVASRSEDADATGHSLPFLC